MIFYIILLHIVIIVISFGSFILALKIGRDVQKRGREVSESWKFFTWGLFFLGLSELVDIFTPMYEQVFGGINIYSETTEIAALALLFLGIMGFLRKRLETFEKPFTVEKK